MTPSTVSIDCRYHKVQTFPSMPIHLAGTIVGTINGKIYVTGYCNNDFKKVTMVVFRNTNVGARDYKARHGVRSHAKLTYKESTWGTDEMLNSKMWVGWCAEISLERRQGGEVWGKLSGVIRLWFLRIFS
ncbi:unnamed protein product [Microthlaspi erraticum]|uniref:Uncharacterized protein n=1 Tax=Microthlaspi erraticum TaxID=1685480 RepID=A0A6D2JEG5_9BRAS|nr:unnamed protein product [Microthlaspi erraticum]